MDAAIGRFKERGVIATPVQDRGWGLLTTLDIGGGETIGLYEPRHPSPIQR